MKDLSMHILDIVQNSIRARASRIDIEINENYNTNAYTLTVKDNGIGMSGDLLTSTTDPFFTTRTTRKVGLGIPLLKQNAERTGGSLKITSAIGKGTTITAIFDSSHPDFLPLGDIAGTVVILTAANPEILITYHHTTGKGQYLYNTGEVKDELDGISISEPSVTRFLKEMIKENLNEIGISK